MMKSTIALTSPLPSTIRSKPVFSPPFKTDEPSTRVEKFALESDGFEAVSCPATLDVRPPARLKGEGNEIEKLMAGGCVKTSISSLHRWAAVLRAAV